MGFRLLHRQRPRATRWSRSESPRFQHSLPGVGRSAFLFCARVKSGQVFFPQASRHRYPLSKHSGETRNPWLFGVYVVRVRTPRGYMGKPCLKRQSGGLGRWFRGWELRIHSQHPRGGPQLPVSPSRGPNTLSWSPGAPGIHIWCTDIRVGKIPHVHIKEKRKTGGQIKELFPQNM